jgi:DmsE family decaheme c-type cytochrome
MLEEAQDQHGKCFARHRLSIYGLVGRGGVMYIKYSNASVDHGGAIPKYWSGKCTDCASVVASIAIIFSGLIYLPLLVLAQPARADTEHAKLIENAHPQFDDAELAALRGYAQQVGAEQPKFANVKESKSPHPHFDDADLAALREYAQQTGIDQRNSANAPRLRIAEADNALDALRDFLGRGAQPEATPDAKPDQPPAVPRQPRPATPRHDPLFLDAKLVGTKTCLFCHASQATSFDKTLMGRIGRTTHKGKFDCESCHGPGSAHVQAVGCAACHGDGGVSTRSGMPSLVGQDPQYLVPAMKAYVTGQRKHELMRALLSGVSEAELNNIALYYARQIPARAQTPPVGDASAGGSATALCAGCHGAQGVSIVPAWPSLAGQDAQYLADAIKAYKHGSRSKAVACAACHGEGGISKRPGMPSLVGLDAQYLVTAMKAYANGQRKHHLMELLLSGTGEAELNSIANYYARQKPARAQTSSVGDPSAGKTASASCAGCHGEQGISANPAWPSLAGQDARYLADALRAYRDGSRSDATMKAFVASLDERTINDLAGFYASLSPAQPAVPSGTASSRDPVVVRNGLVGSLNERTINNIASYYASLRPAQPNSAKNASGRQYPILVSKAAPIDGRSVGGIISFRKDDPGRRVEDNNAICLNCHERGDRTYWSGSTHESRGVACTQCHTVMAAVSRKANLKTVSEPETCFQCHKDRRAQLFRSSHMPVREGKVTCTNCHNPHGSATEAMLKENSVNDNCYKCHAEKRGPFLFEHAPVRENCLSCHDAHGTNNEYLLKVSRPRLCAECHGFGHGLTSGPLAQQTIARSCQNCHNAIHGTNSPAGPLLHR